MKAKTTTQTFEAEVIRTIRAITRLQTQARKLRRQLKANKIDLARERRNLRALQSQMEEQRRRPDVAPMRLFAGAVGMVAGDDDDGGGQ